MKITLAKIGAGFFILLAALFHAGAALAAINTGNGNLFRTETDYAGSGPFPLVFTRTYNSDPILAYQGVSLGMNWRHSYQRSLQIVPVTNSIIAIRGDGKSYQFVFNGSAWTTDADVPYTLAPVTGGYQIRTPDDETESYDTSGLLTSIANRAGVTQTLAYDGQGRLSSVTDTFGGALTFSYDANNRISTMTDPAGSVFTYTYDSTDMLVDVTFPDSTQRAYHYNETGYASGLPYALTGITDENGNRYANFGYDGTGRGILSELAGGADHVDVSYGTGTATVTDALSTARNYTTSAYLGVSKNTGIGTYCQGCWAAITYNAYGYVASQNDFNGNQTTFTYDSTRRDLVLNRKEALTSGGANTSVTRTFSTTWNTTWRLPDAAAEKNSSNTTLRTTSFTYDSYGNMTGKTVTVGTSGASRSWAYTYNGNGSVLTADGPRTDVSDVTTYTYYGNAVTCSGMTSSTGCRGQIYTITDALSHVTTITDYNAHGQPLSITDSNGLVTTLAYDARMRLTSRTVGSEVTSYTYDYAGQLTQVTLPDSSYVSYTYDNAHRLTGMVDTLGDSISYTLDAAGNRTAEHAYDPGSVLKRTHTRVYNALNQLYQDVGAASQTTAYAYDSQGNLTSIDGPLSGTGDTTTQTYDQLNRMYRITNPLSGQINYTLNPLGQVTQVSDPRSKNTTYTINALDNVTSIVSPDSGTTGKTYDNAGNPLVVTDARSKTTTYTYDALNRPLTATFSDSTSLGYTYDGGTYGKGHLTGITFPGGTTTYTYDIRGNLTQKQDAYTSGPTLTTSYAWNSTTGRLTSMTYPSGQVLNISYDSAGQVSGLAVGSTTLLSSIGYFPFGPPSGWTWGNTQPVSRSFDSDGRLSGFPLGAGYSRTLTYDAASRITNITDPLNSANNQTAGYDLLDRLTSWTGLSTNRSYGYDANGNRNALTIGASNYTYSVNTSNNRLTSTTGSPARSYTYDSSGNTTADGSKTWTFNDRGRMATAVISGNTATYTVNGLGERIRKSGPTAIIPAGTLYYAYDEAGHLTGEYDSSGNVIQEYAYLDDALIGIIKGTTTTPILYYAYTDQVGRPWVITDTSNNIVWSWDTAPFGENAPNQNPSGLGTFNMPLRFPGQYADAETGLYYNYFRDYDSETGRYRESDPIGLGGGINTFSYVGDNPYSGYDSQGLFITSVDAACRTNPELCKEIFGQIVENAGNLSGNKCVAEEAQKTADNFRDLWGKAEQFAGVTGGVKLIGATRRGSDVGPPFSISDWSGYPSGVPKPKGPFNITEGATYDAARSAADSANKAVRRAEGAAKGTEVHEIQPVSFGGDPRDRANKVILPQSEHRQFNVWWESVRRAITK